MTALDRKLLRDLGQMKSQAAAIALVMASGVAMFVMSLSTLVSLDYTQSTYYERYRFAHVFADLKRAPNELRERLAEIPGVAHVQTRVVVEATLDVPGLKEPAVARLISRPGGHPPALNDLYLRQGRDLEPGRADEVLANEAFAVAHGFRPGDVVRAVINGRRQELRMVGIALSPEHVIQIQGGDLLPDDLRFGVFWMDERGLAAAYDLEGAFNSVVLTLLPGTSEAEVIRRLDLLLGPYGGRGGYGRDEQVSARYVAEEIRQLRFTAILVPGIFLAVAAFLLHVVMARLVTTQRQEIAVLKAFGYARGQVGWHYLKFTLVIVLLGGFLGTLAGIWLGHLLTQLYTQFYRFPVFHYQAPPAVVLLAFAVSGGASLLGVLDAVRRAACLPPAEAMRPEPPASYRPTIVERIGLPHLLSQTSRMILRHLERAPVKAALSVTGMALAVAIMILGSFSKDALDYLMEFQFGWAERQDVSIAFVEPVAARALHEVEHLPGVGNAEPCRALPVRLQLGHRSRRLALLGLPPEGRLYRLLDASGRPVALPEEGLVINAKLAELLQARVGDTLQVAILEGERAVRETVVAGVINEFSGVHAYMNRHALNRLAREGDRITGAFLQVDPPWTDRLYRRLKETPHIATVTVKAAALRSFADTVAENLLRMRFFNVLFAAIIAFGVVYNSARISLSERQRELATLRVIGFHRAEISLILLGELAVLVVLALPAGMVVGRGFAALLVGLLETELYRIPAVVNPPTYAAAGLTVAVAALLSGLVVRRKLDHLELIGVLKERE